jgi:DNA end-binding protein Ku
MKTIWKGSLTFGLVNIPIELYSAVAQHSLGFKLLHKKCHTPITYKRWCEHCNKEVMWEDVVKGIKLPDDTYFIMTKENLEKLKPAKTDSIDIVEFVDASAVSPIYYDKHYYLMPAKVTDKAFYLFIAALTELGTCAIGQFVMKDKQYVCAIQPYSSGMLLSTLNYQYEVKELPKFTELKSPKIAKQELQLAEELINRLHVSKLDMSKFKDSFAQEIAKKIKQAAKGIAIPKEAKKQKPEKTTTVPLLDALKASLKIDVSKIKPAHDHALSRRSR